VETNERIEEKLMQQKTSDGRDELNLAEFPLCALSRRLRSDQKTLRFEDRLWDKSRNEWITRQLTVTGSDAFGLPTALDDEVLLGLIQLTRQREFADRKVPFTRHELLRLLDWRDDSKNYHRLECSLNRWVGVTLYYQKAWWNRARQCWVDVKFHVLDNVWLCHRGEPLPDTGITEAGAPTSAFVWNEVIFRSFQAGNLKSIDFEFFKSLHSAVAKRLYRFLDKRFWHRDHCEFDLRELACQHLGLSPNYDTANLKRKLLPGIHELEAKGFLASTQEGRLFRKIRAGDWIVSFTRSRKSIMAKSDQPLPNTEIGELCNKLIIRGVSAAVAQRLVERFSANEVERQINIFDWLVSRKDSKVSRNPAGFLVSSIRGCYDAPGGFAKTKRLSPVKAPADARKGPLASKWANEDYERKEARADAYWRSVPEERVADLEKEALAGASVFQKRLLGRRGPLAEVARKDVLMSFAIKNLNKKGTQKDR
jgi:hypothetical protein